MTVSETADAVRAYFLEHAADWKLQPQDLRVEYVPSPGGFGPMNFAVLDSHFSYHVKLNKEAGKLSAWIRSAERLASIYRAPRLLGQLEMAGRHGAVFERLPGQTPDHSVSLFVLDEVVVLLNRLHGDRQLGQHVGGSARSARETILEYHITMCEEDLEEVESALPLPFVDRAAGLWMREETNVLREQVLRSSAFDEPVDSPIHGDLWFGNLLIDADRWWIIDWDDLKIGDPAHDLSLLLFTALEQKDGSTWLRDRDAAFCERFRLYARAALLTFVVDPLADWIFADSFPNVRDEARAHREALHRWALARYRDFYGGP